MNRKTFTLFLFSFLCVSGHAWAQQTVVNSSRSINWTRAGVGVPGGIPSASWTQCGSTIGAYTGTGATITNALAACGANHYVLLGPGTFNLSSSVQSVGHSNVVLRGSGPTQTKLVFSGAGAGGSFSGSIYVATSLQTYSDAASTQPGGTNAATWASGFSQGATSISVSSVGSTGISNGDIIILDQRGDTTDTNGFLQCAQATSPLACMDQNQVEGRVLGGVAWSQEQFVRVVAGCSSACTGSGPFTLTISPGLYANNWNQGNGAGNTGVWFTKPISNVGIENLTIDDTSCPDSISCNSGLSFFNCYSCWAKNLIIVGTRRNHIHLVNGYRDEVRDSYFYGTKNGESQSYGIEFFPANDSLVENNVFQQIAAPIMFGGGAGNVVGYNFSINNVYGPSGFSQGSYFSHSSGNYMNLFEGNVFNSLITDQLHGTGGLFTAFRNWVTGLDWNTCTYSAPGCANTNNFANHPSTQTQPIQIASYTRGVNLIGNVLGTPGYHTAYYEQATPTNQTTNCNKTIYTLGYSNGPPGCNIGGPGAVADDTRVKSTLMRWGNYDTVSGAVRWDATESSPGAATYINAQSTPGSHTLPASFYLSGKPSFFGSVAYPPIGPDVTGGNGGFYASGTYNQGLCIVGSTSGGATCQSNIGGLASAIPAMMCYFSTLSGPTDGSGGTLGFDANVCYPNGSGGPPPAPPAAPTNPRIIP